MGIVGSWGKREGQDCGGEGKDDWLLAASQRRLVGGASG